MAVNVSRIHSCFLVSAPFHSKFDVIFLCKSYLQMSTQAFGGAPLHVSISLHPACHEECPSYTSISDNSYQYNCFQILLARLVGQETSSRKALRGQGSSSWFVSRLGCAVLNSTGALCGAAKERARHSNVGGVRS